MSSELQLGHVSELGQRYLNHELRQHQLQGEIVASRAGDVQGYDSFSPSQRQRLLRLARDAVAEGQVAYGVLAAGASSRMDLRQLPHAVAEMLARSGKDELPMSKALVPVVEVDGQPLNYLDFFLINVRRFSEQTGTQNPVLLFVSERNRAEIAQHLLQAEYRGVAAEKIMIFEQPLEPQIVATEADVQKAERNFTETNLDEVRELSRRYGGHDIAVHKPAGHGEFLHQLVESGTLGQLMGQRIRFISVRNIDNIAAMLDENWLTALGHLIETDSQILVEVSQRPSVQKGGALVRQQGQWRIAEDPSFHGTSLQATDSYYINNAVAILRTDYLLDIYETSAAELREVNAAPDDEKYERLAEIAQRGRVKFPTIVEAKPVRLGARVYGAVIPETNMWESTGVARAARVLPWAVDSDPAAGADLLTLAHEQQRERALRVRFCPTKNWSDYEDPRKRCIAQHIAERIVHGALL